MFDLITGRQKFLLRMNAETNRREVSELGNGSRKCIRVRTAQRLTSLKLLSDLLYLIIPTAELNIEQRLMIVERRIKHHVLKPYLRCFAILPFFGQ